MYRSLSAFFDGVATARRVAARFDPATWWACSVQTQNDSPYEVNVHDVAHEYLRKVIGAHPLPY